MSFSARQTNAESETGEPTSAAARSRADTRRRLVEAGTDLFARDGLHGVTSARIARAAGVATGTFYLHFKDKEALFREIVFAALARPARARMAPADGPPSRRAEAGARAHGGARRLRRARTAA